MHMISHISFSVSDLKKSTAFYDAVMAAIGFNRVYTGDDAAGWGENEDSESFAIKKRVDQVSKPSPGFHLAFHAKTKEAVHAFHAAALKMGGQDNGVPGPRPEYGDKYYAAFVIDPDGYEIEVKLHVFLG